MPVSQETRPMRRLPNSPPRIPQKLRFWIFMFVGIDLALFGLLLVIWATPVNANLPDPQQTGARSPVAPAAIVTVELPTPRADPQRHRDALTGRHGPSVAPTAHRSPTAPVAVPTLSTPTPTHSKPPSAYPTVAPPKTSAPVSTPPESGM